MSESDKKYPVWKVESEYNPDQLTWIIPVEEIKGYEILGGGTGELSKWIASITDNHVVDYLDQLDQDDEETIFKVSLLWMSKDDLNEINTDI